MSDLTQNEHIVLQLMRQGLTSNKVLAAEMNVTEGVIAGVVGRLGKKGLVKDRKVVEIKTEIVKPCQYIQGEPPKPWNTDEIKCGKPATNGSYCKPHYERCYDQKRTAQYKVM